MSTGLCVFALEYSKELLRVKMKELGFFGIVAADRMVPVIERFHADGYFVAEILDDCNLAVCQAAFLENKGFDLRISLTHEDDKLTIKADPKHVVKILSPKGIRTIFEKDAGDSWSEISDLVLKFLDKLNRERLCFIRVDMQNYATLCHLHKLQDDVDLRIRLKEGAN